MLSNSGWKYNCNFGLKKVGYEFLSFAHEEITISRKIMKHWRYYLASLMAQRIKRLPAMQETQVRSLGWENPLAKEMATHSSILAWRFPWTEEPGGLQSMGSQRVWHDWATSHTHRIDWVKVGQQCRDYNPFPSLESVNLYFGMAHTLLRGVLYI